MPADVYINGRLSFHCPLILLLSLAVPAKSVPRQLEATPRDDKDSAAANYPLAYTITPVENGDDSLSQEAHQDKSSVAKLFRSFEGSRILRSVLNLFYSNSRQQNKLQDDSPTQGKRSAVAFDDPIKGEEMAPPRYPSFASSIDFLPVDTGIQPPGDLSAPFSSLGTEWKRTLFGPSGVLTEVFNFVNEKRKQALEKGRGKGPQADEGSSPDFKDFTKVLDALLQRTQSGNFEEPLPEIPFIGICNRLSCGDIYKAVDEFRKSEMFSNFQTAISLIHDPKGWDIIGELLANPELIENFTGKGGAGLLGAKLPATLGNSKAIGDIKEGDGDLGVDFSSLVDERPTKTEKVAVAESVGAPDYYTSVDAPGESHKAPTKALPQLNSYPKNDSMPEFAESVDEFPEGVEAVRVEKEEQIKGSKTPPAPSSSLTNKLETVRQRFTQPNLATVVFIPTTALSTSPPSITATTTRRNFRKDNDYYSMYYDNVDG